MENLLIKEVGFNGGTSIAVQDNERLKIQNDLVLIQVGRKIVPLTNGVNKGILAEPFLSKKRGQLTGYELIAHAVLETQSLKRLREAA